MHALAQSLRAAGVTAYALDIRGHGGSGRRGDIDYIGQIDDDLADFVAKLGPAKSGETRTLVGFSGGAGLAIRFAGGPYGLLFDRYVFLSPILPGSPALRPSAGGWTNISLPRIITIASLGRFGIHWFDGLSVISYAVSPADARVMTAGYSYRLAANFGAGPQHEAYLKNIRRPAAVLVGDADEQVVADQFAPLLQRLDVNIPVTLVPNMKHADMINKPEASQAIIRAISPAEADRR
jgi:pimeloyl-ACP methyl ester carboxylesterase